MTSGTRNVITSTCVGISSPPFLESERPTERPLIVPAEVELKPPDNKRDKREPHPTQPCISILPVIRLWSEDAIRKPGAVDIVPIRYADDVAEEVVKRVPHKPRPIPPPSVRPVPVRRDRLIIIQKPPARVHLLPP